MVTAIIVAAGKGTRMGPDRDKLFLEVAGRPVIAHTWRRFDHARMIDDIVVVVREGMQTAFEELASHLELTKPFHLVAGGAERQDSVWNGLEALTAKTKLVAIQDGARPCTDENLINATVMAAHEMGAAVAAQPVTDTIKQTEDGKLVEKTLDRSKLWSVQTPQAFRVNVIRRALRAVREQKAQVTDDTAACELIGQAVRLVGGGTPNPKVTVPADLAYVELLLRH
jgi:2-C-methyl-D-erythritol 4-phosphate cytidylyltransferase